MKLTEQQAQEILDRLRPESHGTAGRRAYINQLGELLIVVGGYGRWSISKRVRGSALDKLAALEAAFSPAVLPLAA